MLGLQSLAFECWPASCRPEGSNRSMTLFAEKDRGLIRDNRASSLASNDSHTEIATSRSLYDSE